MKKLNVTLKLNAQESLFNYAFYASLWSCGYDRYSSLFWSVFGPTDRYNFENLSYRYAY